MGFSPTKCLEIWEWSVNTLYFDSLATLEHLAKTSKFGRFFLHSGSIGVASLALGSAVAGHVTGNANSVKYQPSRRKQ